MDERLQEEKLEDFVKNTGANRAEAKEILMRNCWDMDESYREIEQMCRLSYHQNNRLPQDHYNYSHNSSPSHYRAIDQGLGTAVNLDNRWNSPQTPPPSYNSLQFAPKPLDQLAPLSVKLPAKAIPIRTGVSRQAGGSHSYCETHKSEPSSLPKCHRPYSQVHSSQVKTPSGNNYHGQQNEPAQRPQMFVPVTDADDTLQEDDDIFDDRITQKPPVFNTYPRLKRGFSNILENESLVSEARHSVQSDILKDNHDMYVQTFVLPDLTSYSEDFRAFLEKELIETSTLVSLEQAGRLNWWAELRLCQRLLPMATSGDGNCLLHAASLAMWGIHDRELILRKMLHDTLTNATYKDALYRRWRFQQTLCNKQSMLVFSEDEWQDEWRNILRLASPLPRSAADPMRSNNCCDSPVTQGKCEEPVVYESLEEFHVFVLAHVLQRPIIVVADTILKDSNGDALAPIPFPGIYLPLEVANHYKSPLLLTYDAAHFSALLPMDQNSYAVPQLPAAIPLVDPELQLLPLHFYKDPGPGVDWRKEFFDEPGKDVKINLLYRFLDVDKLPLRLTDINGDSDRGSCGSQDSDECSSLFKDKDKKEKKKEARMSQQMQTVAKQFGSIGKSMGKKFKQLGKTSKSEKSRQVTLSNEINQGTRNTNYNNQRNGVEYVLVAKLSEKRSMSQQKMINNYLQDAKERFDRELKRMSETEIRSKVASHPPVNHACQTPGCSLYGSPQTDFLCSKCYNAHRHDSILQDRKISQSVYNTFPGRGKQALLSDEIYIYGKSKFYTSSNESSLHQAPEHFEHHTFSSDRTPRTRSPSPDYDNYLTRSMYTSSQLQCKTPSCNFYGSQDCEGFCSKCFKKNIEETNNLAHAITKL
ncbi:OTU domain-containing protein 7B [Bulinus truncatus]|nr:OTU domain-containing protein 7B [Bulinus truncatus]